MQPALVPKPLDPGAVDSPALELVREGWKLLQLQQPLAAWAAWQRALRIDSGNAAAIQALAALEKAPDLPAAARAAYRFQTSADPTRRVRWDTRLRGSRLDDLDAAAEAFASLAREDPNDAEAWFNLALCHAWLGRNSAAIEALDRVVDLQAKPDPKRAEDAWTLAEVLRLGAGAEPLADDLRHTYSVGLGDGLPVGFLEDWPNLLSVEVPPGPLRGTSTIAESRVFEWLDRPMPTISSPRAEDLPRVLGTVIVTPALLRLSSPDALGFASLEEPAFDAVRALLESGRRETFPLPIAWADAAIATFRTPSGLDAEVRDELGRALVEHYFENLWIHQARKALTSLSPLESAREIAKGDGPLRARLAGVVRFREQLGSRLSHASLYQGYPFDRLRRRLGLLPEGSAAVDPKDLSCAGEAELDALDPAALDDEMLADAFSSSAHLRVDSRTARFALKLIERGPKSFARLDPTALYAPLLREALKDSDSGKALELLARGRSDHAGPSARTFTVWSAEILTRENRPDAALAAYLSLFDDPEANASEALDGVETFLDHGDADQALSLVREAQARARLQGDEALLRKANRLVERVKPRASGLA